MLKFFKAPVIWAILIWAFSSIPNTELPNFSFWRILSGDKLVHVFLYGVLSFLLVGSSLKQHMYRRIRYNASPFTLIATSVYGVLIELYQEFVLTDRYGDWADALANFAGAFLGLILFRSIFRDYIR